MTRQNLTDSENIKIRIARWLIVLIIVLVPFHAVLTTWVGSNFGHIDLFRIWKELLMLPLAALASYFVLSDKALLAKLLHWWVAWAALGYAAATLLLGFIAHSNGSVNTNALIYALIINLRFIFFFFLVWIVAQKTDWLYAHWRQLLLIPALFVISFGILQWLVLPADFLRHVGYGSSTIPAIQTVDQQVDFRRIQSTLRGANPLGAYLVLIFTALVALVWDSKKRKGMGWFLVAACAVVLFATYSRSAYIGAVISIGVFALAKMPRRMFRASLIVGLIAALVIGSGIIALRHNDFVQNTVFHSSEASKSATSSNASRASAIEQGLKDLKYEPFGRGPGTAGPASFRNTGKLPRIAENYYIQIAQEVGVLGLGLFMAVTIGVGTALWRRRTDQLAIILLASLAGILFINLISHAWTDDTISLLWWGLAGITLAPGILNKEQTHVSRKNPKNEQ
jgi:hypothetical protein